ncbi:hypothetical protein [Hydrogenophaga sp. BPS33]|uniref:hypothetical protein n=1 Tax=Hydrogenophaga sp. BPS33 TaxID=2651974 RepID=UPI00131FE70E|nr:hypothetical protein [Hydrogenophaga sp. BPS33]QHE89367.1 hypothetical protein F9K07_30810 [Hydrogenophaga sp. BPS33]
MKLVFDVYTHSAKGQWGFSASGPEVWTAEIKPGKALKLDRVEAITLGGLLTKRVRMGYVRATRTKYLHQTLTPEGDVYGEFSEVHPDVLSPDGSELVLMATKSLSDDLSALTAAWETKLQMVSVLSEQAAVWLKRQELAKQYFTAHATHPAFALVLADWAMENKQIVLCQKGAVPTTKPMNDPLAWKKFLSEWFKEETVQRAMEQLSWSLRDAMLAPVMRQPENINESGDAQGWNAEAGLAAF